MIYELNRRGSGGRRQITLIKSRLDDKANDPQDQDRQTHQDRRILTEKQVNGSGGANHVRTRPEQHDGRNYLRCADKGRTEHDNVLAENKAQDATDHSAQDYDQAPAAPSHIKTSAEDATALD